MMWSWRIYSGAGKKIRALLQSSIVSKAKEPKQQLLVAFDAFENLQSNPLFRGCPFINASAEFATLGSGLAMMHYCKT